MVGVLLRTALRGLQTSAGPSAMAVVTIALALLLTGAFALLVANMGGLLARAGQDLQVIAYLEPGIGAVRSRELAVEAGAIAGVEAVALVLPDRALERFRQTTGGAELLEGLEAAACTCDLHAKPEPAPGPRRRTCWRLGRAWQWSRRGLQFGRPTWIGTCGGRIG